MTEWIAHQDNVAGFGSQIGAGLSDGESDIGTRERRCIIDAITHHGHTSRRRFVGVATPVFDKLGFLMGKQTGVNLGYPDSLGDTLRDGWAIPSKESDVANSQLPQLRSNPCGIRAH